MSTNEHKSDIVRLLQNIDETHEAAQQALYGLAMGVGRHDFIQAKPKLTGQYAEQETQSTGFYRSHPVR